MENEVDHLRNKIEIIYKYNSSYVPEFPTIYEINDMTKLNEIYQLALSRVHQEKDSQHRNMLETILPLFEVVESRKTEASTIFIANFMLMSVQGTIKGHLETLANIKERSEVEERCLVLCQQIATLKQDCVMQFFPLFKEYLIILIEHHDKITAPLSFEDPSKLVKDMQGSSGVMGQTCLII